MATPEERAAIDAYGRLRSELASLLDRAADLEAEAAEHALVARTLEPMDAGRRAYRLVREKRGMEGERRGEGGNGSKTDRLPLSLFLPTLHHRWATSSSSAPWAKCCPLCSPTRLSWTR